MAIIMGGLGFGLYSVNNFKNMFLTNMFANMRPPPAAVSVATAKLETAPNLLPGIGSISAVHQVTVTPEVSGRVTQIMFQSGATVKAGDPLVQLNDKPDQGDLANYRAQARLAEISLGRARQLAASQFGPQSNVDTYQASLEQANAGIAKTQATIAQKLVRAPFDGDLGVRQIEVGQYVSAGNPIVTLTDLDHLYVDFTLAERARGLAKVGQVIKLTTDAYPGREFEARVSAIEPQQSSDTRTFKLQASMDNPDHLLQPGMFANVNLVLPPAPENVTVPESAVDFSLYGDQVFILTETGKETDDKHALFKLARTPVSTGKRFDNKVVILSGVKAGDRVAASGQHKLQDGGMAVISEVPPLPTPTTTPTN